MVTITNRHASDVGENSRFPPEYDEDSLVYPTAAGEYDMVDDYAVDTFDDEGSVKTVSSTGVTDQSNADTVESVDRSDDEMDRLDQEFSSSTAQLRKLNAGDEHIRPVRETDSASSPVRDADAETEPERLSFSINTDAEDNFIQESEVTIRPLNVEKIPGSPAKPVEMPKKVGTSPSFNLRRGMFCFVTLLLLCFSIFTAMTMNSTSSFHIDPATELAIRRQTLTESLRSANISVKTDAILQYPKLTIVDESTSSTKLTYPTEAAVRFVRPDQLFISLPRKKTGGYPKNSRVEVLRNDKNLENVNSTVLIPGLVHVALEPAEANGNLVLNVLSGPYLDFSLGGMLMPWSSSSLRRDTLNVRLGNRLLQRATYHNAATQVQRSVRHEVSVVRRMWRSIQSEVFDGIYSEATRLANRSVSAFSWASLHTNSALQEATSASAKVARLLRTGPSEIDRLLRHSIPTKPDVTAHVKRANSNARAIRGRLFAGLGLIKTPARAQTNTSDQHKLASLRSMMKQQLDTAVKSFESVWKRSDSRDVKIKASDRSQATVTIVWKQPETKVASGKTSKAPPMSTGH